MATFVITYLDGSKQETKAGGMDVGEAGKIVLTVGGYPIAAFNVLSIQSIVKKED